jgi:hypothetical protein
MLRRGEMVKADSGPVMQFLHFDEGVAACLVIDEHGQSDVRFVHPGSLRRMIDVFRPRTCWRETTGFDLIEIEREERAAAESRRQQRKASRKSKRSNKLKRRVVAA